MFVQFYDDGAHNLYKLRRRIISRIIMCDLAFYVNIKFCARQEVREAFQETK